MITVNHFSFSQKQFNKFKVCKEICTSEYSVFLFLFFAFIFPIPIPASFRLYVLL